MTRNTTEQERLVLSYLNDLRDSGITNMFGAAPFIESSFGIERDEARKLLSLWMDNFNEAGDYETVKTKD